MTVGMSSLEGFCSTSDSPRAGAEARVGAAVLVGVLCSLFGGDRGDGFWARIPQLRLGERQRRRALNWRSSSPRRLPREVRRTGLLRLGRRRLRRECEGGEKWKYSSVSSPLVSTMEGSLGSTDARLF